MAQNYQELKFPVKECCIGYSQYPQTVEEFYKDKLNQNIALNIEQLTCNCGLQCWQNLFTFFSTRKYIALKKLSITWGPLVTLKKSVFEQIVIGVSSLSCLEKLKINIYFKNNFIDVIAVWIQQMIEKINNKTKKFSIKIFQIQEQEISDDARIAKVLRGVMNRNNIESFSFGYFFYKDNYNYDIFLIKQSNCQSLKEQTLNGLSQILNTDCIRKMKIQVNQQSQLIQNQNELLKFCQAIQNSKMVDFSIQFDQEIYTNKTLYNKIESAWLNNQNLRKLSVSFNQKQSSFNYRNSQTNTNIRITKFNKNWQVLKLSKCDIDFSQLPIGLKTLYLCDPSINFYQDLEISLVGKVHQLQNFYMDSTKPILLSKFPSVIESFFQNLEVLQIKNILNNKRMLNYLQANTNLHTLKLISFNPNLLNQEIQNTSFTELIQTVIKCPHLKNLYLNIPSANFILQPDQFTFGKYLESFYISIFDAQYSIILKLQPILDALNYNSNLLKLVIDIKFFGYIVFAQQNYQMLKVDLSQNETLTEFEIYSTKKIKLPDNILVFEEKTKQRYCSMMQLCAFNNQISPFLSYNPQLSFWDLYL
ncbi:hypothetical protein TTHERM_00304310 (macronuclear) [Tetrahymena thermophila SB210]|uniref:Uncharacterized protein n=1 Tax=Tetrahymena thermophila (strain SB210) TaxID=312017 RepID=I7M945_TETTS|nr:hypothetical protein TTHERM_00304310 [Tetrahymena thermophila SB210]EAS00762.1 hypothetical protein TTHERM_00304310 [Tetrahymena thermophila SB210]|eukprot:XP_001021007.1 hypothetical protein TTHERM_00304310 [Tetrahymena thermophila SB210]